jgi:hypothetical protein
MTTRPKPLNSASLDRDNSSLLRKTYGFNFLKMGNKKNRGKKDREAWAVSRFQVVTLL